MPILPAWCNLHLLENNVGTFWKSGPQQQDDVLQVQLLSVEVHRTVEIVKTVRLCNFLWLVRDRKYFDI
jgi:hypothetical protein